MKFQYGVDERVPFLKSVAMGLQWAAVLISSIVILGKVIGDLHFVEPSFQVLYLQKLLFVSGAALVFQILLGHRLPVVPGPAAVLLIGVMASQGFGMPVVYTSVMLGGALIAFAAFTGLFDHVQKLFSANVVAVVLLLIAFTLAPAIQRLIVGPGEAGQPLRNLGFALALIALMFAAYRLLTGIWRSTLIIWAMLAGSAAYLWIFPAGASGTVYSGQPWFGGIFRELTLDPSIEPGVLLSFVFCYLALAVNDLGSIRSVGELLETGDMGGRIRRGIQITGIANAASGFMGVIGPVNYSLSPGIIAATSCASRYTLLPAAAVMLAAAFVPAATGIMGSVPSVVVGAVLTYVMAAQVSAGLLVALGGDGENGFSFENGLVIGLPVLLGNLVAFFPPEVVEAMSPFLRPLLGNGFVVGVVSALLMEHFVAVRRQSGRDRA